MPRSSLLLLLCIWIISSATADAQPLQVDVQERVLDNGVTVLVWERPAAGRIGAPIAEAVERLQREVTDERNRLADCFRQRDVTAEVEASCTHARLDSLETLHLELAAEQNAMTTGIAFDLIYQRAGGTGLTASTGRDWMKFDIDLPANQLELFMWMERSRVENPVFRYFEPEREVVVDQIRRQDNRPDGPYRRVLRSLTYDAHPYGWAHWFSDLTRATREDHWEIFYTYFIPQNLV
ncbi:MAG: insulinase family protein, partial [Spiribacter salinus]